MKSDVVDWASKMAIVRRITWKVRSGWNQPLGEVTEVLNLPGQDVLSIKSESGEVLIPFVHQLVPVVDIKAKRMTIIPPDFYESEDSQ